MRRTGAVGSLVGARGDIVDNVVDGVAPPDAGGYFAVGINLDGDGTVARGNRVRGVYSESGSSAGIRANGEEQTVAGNQAVNVPAAGGESFGILANATTFCHNNNAAGFMATLPNCMDHENLSHDIPTVSP